MVSRASALKKCWEIGVRAPRGCLADSSPPDVSSRLSAAMPSVVRPIARVLFQSETPTISISVENFEEIPVVNQMEYVKI